MREFMTSVEELRKLADDFAQAPASSGEEYAIDRVAVAVLRSGAAVSERLEALIAATENAARIAATR